ncbi:oxidoreductase NAD-binding domain-containing protein 1 [Echinops telfairi]|uniref:Oxidoreductase NAD-binding domain-containing protein 1 n=1 Tax=Echinops telfairi TaxID=9371 RepID=A0ABM1VM46_ECHTE|nr:oxidoreductase NAD-binding domain-containing protein 1 [Echinops telfairi]
MVAGWEPVTAVVICPPLARRCQLIRISLHFNLPREPGFRATPSLLKCLTALDFSACGDLAHVHLPDFISQRSPHALCSPATGLGASHVPGSTAAWAAAMIPGLLQGSIGAICSRAASSRVTPQSVRHLSLTSVMKSKKKTDHLERTASFVRREVVSTAKVCGAADESPSVKLLRLLVAEKDFSFKAGQWVDFFIPGVSVVGGFSICSSPRMLEQERTLELAVKYTHHPPALWIHNQCTLDSEVALRVGGEFFYDPQPTDASRNLVLIAGGVGINPLLSILRHAADLHREEQTNKGSGRETGTIKLFYSARNTSELLFKKNILDLVNEFPEKIACSLHVTKQTTQISAELKPYITEGRITEKEIRDHISEETLFYICGPPPMTDFFSKQLEDSCVPKEHVCFEKWW